ncbi:MAG TPA: MFS transporter [Steroidobacteraceae bacterium]|nr:MFS transporter [Steroidobacteraceae bacterium]
MSGLKPDRTGYSIAYKRSVILLLTLAYTLNSADRTLIAIIGQPLKADLNLTDAQLGVLIGTAFATLYAFSGLPIARLAERFNRVIIISTALAVWSALTALCGAAANFTQLLMLRMAVGVGEAGCTPPAHSLISDYFVPTRRSTALSIYSCGISFGYMLSAVVGGYAASHYGWRIACLVVGLPGIGVALLLRWLIKEPPRGHSDPLTDSTANQFPTESRPAVPTSRPRFADELKEVMQTARTLFLKRPIANMLIGLIVASFAAQGSYAFVPAYFSRAFSLDYTTIGVVSAVTGGAMVGLGLAAGGILTDALGARDAKWYALVPAGGLIIALPLYVLAFLQADWKMSALFLGAAGFFQYLSFGPTVGVVQNVTDSRRRATATALVYILLTVICLGFGPPFTGWLIDHLAQLNFSALMPDGSFKLICGSGKTSAGATPVLKQACEATLALASRQGIIATVLLYAWAAVHYLVGAIGLSREMRGAHASSSAT